ncbi:MAG TPA: extracellular solute-binding protein [Anaeromyxobacter sp.]|nr:extracellular solute-binding protein [Anaeromyxobacter sp.]
MAKEQVTLKYIYWGSPQEKLAMEKACADFSKKTGINVVPVYVPEADYTAKLTAMAAAGESPDAGYCTSQLASVWSGQGKFVNWFEMMKNDPDIKKSDFVDGIWFQNNPDDAYGISTAVEDFGLFYNKDAFKKAGLPEPPTTFDKAWTWDEFVKVAQKLTIDRNGKNATEPGFDPNAIKQFGVTFENWWGPVTVHVLNNGGDYLTADGKGFGLSSPRATAAIQRLADLANKYHVAPNPIQFKAIPSQAAAIQAGLAAMSMHGQWINLDLGAAKANYGIGVLPKMDANTGTILISGVSVVFKDSKHIPEAWALSKYLASDGALPLYQDGLWMPTMKKFYTDPALLAKWAGPDAAHPVGFKDSMMDMVLHHSKPSVVYYVKNFGKLDSMVAAALDPVWAGKKTAEQAMRELEPQITPEIQGKYQLK